MAPGLAYRNAHQASVKNADRRDLQTEIHQRMKPDETRRSNSQRWNDPVTFAG